MNDSTEFWLTRLSATGSERDDAIAKLREILWLRLQKTFRGERRVDDAMPDDVVQDALVKTIDIARMFRSSPCLALARGAAIWLTPFARL